MNLQTLTSRQHYRLRSTLAIALCLALSGAVHAGEICDLTTAGEDSGGATASGAQAIACGTDADASGENSNALGAYSAASGASATAVGGWIDDNFDGVRDPGEVAEATGFRASAFGASSEASGDASTALGAFSTASGQSSSAIGFQANATQVHSTALGRLTNAAGIGSTAIGSFSSATGAQSTATGFNSFATGENSTANGARARAVADNSVALGADSVADQVDTVSVGSAGNERRIVNVANGTGATDAVNVSQLESALTQTNDRFDGIDQRLHHQDDRIDRAGALGAAMIGMAASASAVESGQTRVGIAAGTYGGKQALSVGVQHRFNPRTAMTLGGAFSGSEQSATVGVGFGF